MATLGNLSKNLGLTFRKIRQWEIYLLGVKLPKGWSVFSLKIRPEPVAKFRADLKHFTREITNHHLILKYENKTGQQNSLTASADFSELV